MPATPRLTSSSKESNEVEQVVAKNRRQQRATFLIEPAESEAHDERGGNPDRRGSPEDVRPREQDLRVVARGKETRGAHEARDWTEPGSQSGLKEPSVEDLFTHSGPYDDEQQVALR